ncbi:putative immunity protein [Arthrobacter sp. A5]|uniref:putative immunity protein n=1 Tax=Arthrobacter sp. A5 TaxID=576926 RepID=UPI003DA9670B
MQPCFCENLDLDLFKTARPDDLRPGQTIKRARTWLRGKAKMMEARAARCKAMAPTRPRGDRTKCRVSRRPNWRRLV